MDSKANIFILSAEREKLQPFSNGFLEDLFPDLGVSDLEKSNYRETHESLKVSQEQKNKENKTRFWSLD